MKRSEINQLVRDATACFEAHGWALPPNPKWDVTDFGFGDWRKNGLVLVNLAEEPEYCEKLMYAKKGMITPIHCHRKKKEDIAVRWGTLCVMVFPKLYLDVDRVSNRPFTIRVNGEGRKHKPGAHVDLSSGERITLEPGMHHAFFPKSDECIFGEVSTANDDLNDNFFTNPNVDRFSAVEEDETAIVKLVSDP